MLSMEQVEREIRERNEQRERKMEQDRERLRLKAQAYNNMMYYSTTPEQKACYEAIYRSL